MPIPMNIGSSMSIWVIDSGNIGFILLVLMLSPLIDLISVIESKSMNLSTLFFILILLLYLLFILELLLRFFILYETLIILLFFILFLLLPSYYRIRTAFFLLIFSMLGSVNFIISLILLLLSNWLLISLLILLPFYIKIPCFPFFYWLPEVHCEVNSSISLYLAGLLLKLGLFGMFRFILSSFLLSISFLLSFLNYFIIIGVIIISNSIFRFYDLKKIIAFSSILHLNLSLVSIYSCSSIGLISGIITSLSHAFSSVSLFHYIGLLFNKTSTRYLDSLFFIDIYMRGLFLFFLLSNISFPVTYNFIGEILAFISYWFISCFLCFNVLFSTFLSFLYWFLLLNRKLPYHSYSNSLNWIEYLILCWFMTMIYTNGMFYLLDIFPTVMPFQGYASRTLDLRGITDATGTTYSKA